MMMALILIIGVILLLLTQQSQALSTPSKPSPLRKTNINDDVDAKRTVSNIFSVVSHIQNPDLYQPSWADNTRYEQGTNSEGKTVVASRDVKKGHVLTLFPIHALGLRTLGQKNTSTKKKKKKKKKKQQHKQKDTEFVAYDVDRDAKYFTNQEPGLRMKLNIPLDNSQPALCVLNGDRKNKVLFAMVFRDEVLPGWMGHRIKTANTGANCVTIPLPGAGKCIFMI